MLLLYEYRTKTVVLRIMNLALMKFSLLPCGLKHTPFIYFFYLPMNLNRLTFALN